METRKLTRVIKYKNSVGKCMLCKNNANWIIETKDCVSITRIPVCDRHRPKPGGGKNVPLDKERI